MRGTLRGGRYSRVYKPDWNDPLDTSFSRELGGRWNAPESFGALYLNATFAVAAANARWQHAGRAIGLFDLRPERRPRLLVVTLPRARVLDVVSDAGVAALRLPSRYPWDVDRDRCRPIGARAYRVAAYRGIACRSAAECRPDHWIGEELAWFDRSPHVRVVDDLAFAACYPDPHPRLPRF